MTSISAITYIFYFKNYQIFQDKPRKIEKVYEKFVFLIEISYKNFL